MTNASDWQVLLACLSSPWSSAFQLAAHARTTAAETHGALARLGATGLTQSVTQHLPHLPHELYAPTELAVAVVAERWGCDEGVVAWRARMSERRFWWLRAALDIAQEVNGLCARLAHARPDWHVTWETGIVRTYHKHTLMLHGRLAIAPEARSGETRHTGGDPAVRRSPYYLLIDRGTQSPLGHWRVLRYLALGSRRFAKDAAVVFPPLLIVTTTSFRAIALMRLAHRLNFQAPLAATWDRATLLGQGAHVAEWTTLIRTEQSRVVLSPAAPFALGLLRAAEPKHLPHVLCAPATTRRPNSAKAGTTRATTRAIAVPALSHLPAWGAALEAIEALDTAAMRVLAFVCQHPVCSMSLVAACAAGGAVRDADGNSDTAVNTILAQLRDARLVTEIDMRLPVSAESLIRLATAARSDHASDEISSGTRSATDAIGKRSGRHKRKVHTAAVPMSAAIDHLTRIISTSTLHPMYPRGSVEHSLLRAFRSGIRPTPMTDDAGKIKLRAGREVWIMRLPGLWRATPEAVVLYALRAGLGSEEALRRYTATARDRLRRPYHALAVDQFFYRLQTDTQRAARATRPLTVAPTNVPGAGAGAASGQETAVTRLPYYALGDYVDESMARASFRHGLSAQRYSWRPDGYGTLRCGDRVTRFWLEIDGTGQTRARLDAYSWQEKAEALCAYYATDIWTRAHETFPTWLIVTANIKSVAAIQSALREAAATFAIAVPAVYVASTTAILQRGPLAPVWVALHDDARADSQRTTGSVLGMAERHTFTYAFAGARQPQVVQTAQRRDLIADVQQADALGLIHPVLSPAPVAPRPSARVKE